MRGAAARPPAPVVSAPAPARNHTRRYLSRVERSSPPPGSPRFFLSGFTRFTRRPPRGYHCALEANGARWPSRSSKSAVSCFAGELGSTPRRFRQSLSYILANIFFRHRRQLVAVEQCEKRCVIGQVANEDVGLAPAERIQGEVAGRHRDRLRAPAMRAADVVRRVADDDHIGWLD